jgi:UDP-perosamine 4-acetyltransferase
LPPMTQVIGLGAGGHAKVVIEVLRMIGGYEFKGLLDPNKELRGTEVLGVPVIGDDGDLEALFRQGITHAFIGLGGVGDNGPRKRLFENAQRHGFKFVDAIHPQAIVSPSAEIGSGPSIMAASVINAEARLGDNVLINSGAIIEHDCVIGDHCHVATGARLASTVLLGDGVHVGAGATVRQSITIGEGVIVGAGAVVVKDVAAWTLVTGVPAQPQKKLLASRSQQEESV